MLFPAGDPRYYRCARTLAIAQTPGTPFAEDERLRWHPAAGGLATLHGEGKVSVIPAVGYDNSDKSHFTSRHYWEVGATDAQLRTGWLGRYLDAVGTPDNPMQGLSLDAALHPALATAKVPVATLQAADQYTFAPPGRAAHPLEASMLQEAANIGAAHAKSTDAGLAAGRRRSRYESHHLYYQLGNVQVRLQQPGRLPGSTDPFPHRLAGLAAMIAGGLPVRVVGITAPGQFDTHAAQAAALDQRPAAHLRLAARVPARPRGARHRRPRARPRLVGVRPPRRRERLGRDRPRLGRDRLPDRDEGDGQQIGELPGRHGRARPARATSRRRADFRARLLGDPRAVARRRRERRSPERRRRSSGPRCSSEAPSLAARSSPSPRSLLAPAAGRSRRRPPRAGLREGVLVRALAAVGRRGGRRSSSSSTSARTRTTCASAGSAARARMRSTSSSPATPQIWRRS